MKLRSSSLLIMTALGLSAQTPDLAGDWDGSLSPSGATFRPALHVTRTDAEFSATLESVDHGVHGLKIAKVGLTGPTLYSR